MQPWAHAGINWLYSARYPVAGRSASLAQSGMLEAPIAFLRIASLQQEWRAREQIPD